MDWKQRGSWKVDSQQAQEVARWIRHSISINRMQTMLKLMAAITTCQKIATGKVTWLDEAHASIIALAIDEQAIKRYNRKAVSMGWPLGGINRSYHTHAIGATMCEMMERGDLAPFGEHKPNDATTQAIEELTAGVSMGEELAEAREEIEKLKVAFHDAITRPMGQVPDSGSEFYDPSRYDT